uniref:Protein-serine/threonine kinase n=1 Tax=Aureoumbra lagunensis TaxID=44058 RepID=A0A7S3NMF4_9STRA
MIQTINRRLVSRRIACRRTAASWHQELVIDRSRRFETTEQAGWTANIQKNIDVVIESLSKKRATTLSLRQMYEMASLKSASLESRRLWMARYLHRELPIRMCQRISELKRLPYGIGELADVVWIINTYSNHVLKLLETDFPENEMQEKRFAYVVESTLKDKVSVPRLLARAVRTGTPDLCQKGHGEYLKEIDTAMNIFFTSRIGLRLLVDHYLSLREGFGGEISSTCRPAQIAHEAGLLATNLVRKQHGNSPQVQVRGNLDATFTYPPQHCRYILLELLKNATRATAENFSTSIESHEHLPPVEVIVVAGDEDISLKISDVGGGFTRTQKRSACSWFFSSYDFPAQDTTEQEEPQTHSFLNDPGLLTSGHGIGIPLSRITARYFGGSLELFGLQGYGVDAYVHLSRLGTDCENLPSRVRFSPASRDSTLF